ncbi:MAG: hypothetical protein V1856_01725 [Candidatus Liptonbacteria bacterium]
MDSAPEIDEMGRVVFNAGTYIEIENAWLRAGEFDFIEFSGAQPRVPA